MAQRRLWTTDSLRRALLEVPPGQRWPSRLHLPLADLDYGEIPSPAGGLTRDAAEAWASGLFDAVVSIDRLGWELYLIETQTERAQATDSVPGSLRRQLNEKGRERQTAGINLKRLFTFGLEGRDGAYLSEQEHLVYAHVAVRLDPWRSPWHACERCDVVYKARRTMVRASYLCPGCKGQRIPALRSASELRQCVSCAALFVPADVRQRTCEGCRRAKSTRSRHPERIPRPGTSLRRAYIDLEDRTI
jgi:hypothetical protein